MAKTVTKKTQPYPELFAAAEAFVKEFKKFNKDFTKAEVLMTKKQDVDNPNCPYYKNFNRLEKINERVYDILRRGGLSY